MKLVPAPGLYSGSSGVSGMKIVPLAGLVVILSRPWSKNWPKNVKKLLNGADKPLSGVTFGMNRLCGRPRPVWPLADAFIGVAVLPNVVMSSAVPSMPSAPAKVVPVSSAVP